MVYVYPTERSLMNFVMAFKVVPCNSLDSSTWEVFQAHWVVQGHLWFVGKSQDLFFKVFSQHSILALDLADPALQPQEQAVELPFFKLQEVSPRNCTGGCGLCRRGAAL